MADEVLTQKVEGGVLVITPLTPFTNKTANYWLKIE